MTTPAEAIEAQRCAKEDTCYRDLITPEELDRLYAIKDAFEKVMGILKNHMVEAGKSDGYVVK